MGPGTLTRDTLERFSQLATCLSSTELVLEPSLALGTSVAYLSLDWVVLRKTDMVWPRSLAQQVEFSNKDLKINVTLRFCGDSSRV